MSIEHKLFLEKIKQRGYKLDVFYDIGANVGRWSRECQQIFPEARFELFEPLSGRLPELDKLSNIDKIPMATMHPIAISNSNQQGNIKILGDHGLGSSIILLESDFKKNIDMITCEYRKLDDFIQEKKLPQPDFIKIDTQASEIKVLEGSIETLKNTTFLFIETWTRRVYGPETPLFHELCNWLYKHNFILYEIFLLENGRDIDGVLRWFDVVFINKSKNRFPIWML